MRLTKPYIDKDEAPEGYYAVDKKKVRLPSNILSPGGNGNICKLCDWRPDCSKVHSCMSYDRADGIGVVFKRKV